MIAPAVAAMWTFIAVLGLWLLGFIAWKLHAIHETLKGEGPSILTQPINAYGETIGEAVQGQIARGQREVEHARKIWRYSARRGIDVGEDIDWGRLMLTEPKERVRELAADEEARLFAKLPPDLAAVAEFAMLSGQRRTAIITLRWSDVDLRAETATITLKGADRGRHTFPLTPRMVAIVANRPKAGAHVFTYECERTAPKRGKRPARVKGVRYPMSKQGWMRKWRKALADAEIEDFRFHDLRHTALTRVTRASGIAAAQRLAGHTHITTTARYAHVTENDVRAAMIAADSQNSPTSRDASNATGENIAPIHQLRKA